MFIDQIIDVQWSYCEANDAYFFKSGKRKKRKNSTSSFPPAKSSESSSPDSPPSPPDASRNSEPATENTPNRKKNVNSNKGEKKKRDTGKWARGRPFNPRRTWGQKALFTRLWNRCIFSCDSCDFSDGDFETFSRHRNRAHGKMVPSRDSSLFATKFVYHRCAVCSKAVLHDSTVLRMHLFRGHRMGIDKYTKSHGAEASSSRFKTWVEQGVVLKEGEVVLQRSVTVEKVLAGHLRETVPALQKCRNSPKELAAVPKGFTTTAVADLCTYRCPLCQAPFGAYARVICHLRAKHRGETHSLGQLMEEHRYHRCKMCDKRITCDKTSICSHARVSHKMNLEKYRAVKVKSVK